MIIDCSVLQTYSEGLKLNMLNFNFIHHALQMHHALLLLLLLLLFYYKNQI